jgi:hypothetical protein
MRRKCERLGVDPETVAKASGLALEKIQELAERTQ